MRTSSWRVAALLAPIAVASMLSVSPAQADDDSEATGGVTYAGAGEIAAAEQASSQSEATGDEEAEFLEEQARAGNTVDEETINSAELDGATMVWQDGVQPVEIQTSALMDGDSVAGGEVAQVLAPDPSALADDLVQGSQDTGLGSDSILRMTGAVFNGGYCTTTTYSENKLTQCFERYKIRNTSTTRDYYYYGRWATGEAENNTFPNPDWSTTKIDIRSRPWTGKRSNFAALMNYWPKAEQKSCNDSGTVGVGYGGFSAEMPIRNCEESNPIIDANAISAGVIYDQGLSFSGRVKSADFAMVFSTWEGKAAPMGDYGYAKFCKYSYADCDGVLRKDGW